jgi:ferrous iron transport protein A
VDIMSAVSASRFPAAPDVLVLGEASVGFVGTIRSVGAPPGDTGLPPPEHERRLIELGFVEGAPVEILHQGLIGGDPIAVRVNETTIALRRRDAAGILVEPVGDDKIRRAERGE